MKNKKKVVFLVFVACLALFFALPATRAQLDWYWTESRDDAADYLRYSMDWPNSPHAIEARLRYEQKTWNDTKRAMIAEALKKRAAVNSDPAAVKARRQRQERFFWRQVTNENTIVSYQDYLQRYPSGEFASQAHRQLDALKQQAATDAATNSPTQ